MTKHCTECKQALTFAERWGIRKHVCDPLALQAIAHEAQEAHKNYLEAKRQQQETAMLQREALRIKQASYQRAYTPPVRSSGSSRRVSSSDDDSVVTSFAYSSPSYSSYSSDSSSSYSSSCDSSSSSDSGSCSSGD